MAQGTPSKNAVVLSTHSAFPLNDKPVLVNEVSADAVRAVCRRAPGGMTSFRADRRSNSDSLSGTVSECAEISDSGAWLVRMAGLELIHCWMGLGWVPVSV